MAVTASARPALARTVRVETPEQVELGFEIADLGSRFLAFLLDLLVLIAALVGLGLLARWGATRLDLSDRLLGWGAFTLTLVSFVVLWGYFVYFEGFRSGRTPGKRWVGIRVVHEGGYPLTLRGAAVRNLVRLVDLQPVFSWMVGGLAMMIHPRTQRLGDMAAGTIVVRDRGALELSESELRRLVRGRRGSPELTDEAYEALGRFVERRKGMEREARGRVAARLGEALDEALDEPLRHRAGAAGTVEDGLVALYDEERERRGAGGTDSVGSSPLVGALVRSQGARWLEYRELVRRAERRGLEALSEDELERFAGLYRLTAADLARARTYGAGASLVFTLERWVGSGHNLLYREDRRSWTRLLRWLRFGFPRRVRARRGFVALAALFLFVPGIATSVAVELHPPLARQLMPREMIARAETAPERARQGGQYVEVPDVHMPVLSSRLIANNVQVTFLAFAGGVLAGIGTALLLVFNGVHIGAAVGLFRSEGAGRLLWEFVAPHGAIELTAITIAGAAGLLLGSAIVAPGRLTRGRALSERAREGVSLLAGTTLLLILAGLVEGFVSPAPVPAALKLLVGLGVALAVLAYLVLGGRRAPPDPLTDGPGT